ncbi:hypothetical protein BC831DRAFT_444397 [Entophlyctis helioformis]|nr:hypothetical protein BC831DRAFT_444397 [Entophlyctis helioformis]
MDPSKPDGQPQGQHVVDVQTDELEDSQMSQQQPVGGSSSSSGSNSKDSNNGSTHNASNSLLLDLHLPARQEPPAIMLTEPTPLQGSAPLSPASDQLPAPPTPQLPDESAAPGSHVASINATASSAGPSGVVVLREIPQDIALSHADHGHGHGHRATAAAAAATGADPGIPPRPKPSGIHVVTRLSGQGHGDAADGSPESIVPSETSTAPGSHHTSVTSTHKHSHHSHNHNHGHGHGHGHHSHQHQHGSNSTVHQSQSHGHSVNKPLADIKDAAAKESADALLGGTKGSLRGSIEPMGQTPCDRGASQNATAVDPNDAPQGGPGGYGHSKKSSEKYGGDLSKFEHLLVYTKASPLPSILQTVREVRFVLRFFQLVLSAGAFIGIGIASFDGQYTSAIQGMSGINALCLTSISSVFVSLCCMFLYAFPGMMGVPPHRHGCFSRVEVAIDVVFVGLWLGSSTKIAMFGKCPRESFVLAPNGSGILTIMETSYACGSWMFTILSAYAAMSLFLATLAMGVYDLKRQDRADIAERHNMIMFARGNWMD